jgi:hypothetical protein
MSSIERLGSTVRCQSEARHPVSEKQFFTRPYDPILRKKTTKKCVRDNVVSSGHG